MIAVLAALALLTAATAWRWATAVRQREQLAARCVRQGVRIRHLQARNAALRAELEQVTEELQRGWAARDRQTGGRLPRRTPGAGWPAPDPDMEAQALREIALLTSPPEGGEPR